MGDGGGVGGDGRRIGGVPALPATVTAVAPRRVATLFPGYFAMVMATGIIAVAASQQNVDWLAQALYVIAAVAYVVLAVLLVLRVVRYRSMFAADVTNHAKGFAFLTTVAGTNVLGRGFGGDPRVVRPGVGAVVVEPRPVGRVPLRHADRRGHRPRQARPPVGHQRHLVPPDRVDRIDRRPRRAAVRPATVATRWRSPHWPRSPSVSSST